MDMMDMSDLSQIPAAMPPDGQTSNFINPKDISDVPMVALCVLLPLMLMFVLLRIGARVRLTHALWADDVLCIIAAAFIFAWAGVLLSIHDARMGRHAWDIPLSDITESVLQRNMIIVVLNFFAAMFVRLSLLSLYLRIFKPIRWARITIFVGMALIAAFYVLCTIILLAITVPRPGQTWMYTTFKHVKLEADVSVAQGYFAVFSDLLILGIPLRLVSDLSLQRKRKIGVLAVFSTGLLAFGCSVAGLVSRIKVEANDSTWTGTLSYIYVAFEINIGLICSCMPVVSVPLKFFVESVVNSWSSMRKYSRTKFSRSDDTGKAKEALGPQLPEVPSGTMSGMKTFIRRLYRTERENTVHLTDVSAFSKLGSVDEGYHEQLRAMHVVDIESSAAWSNGQSAPGSRGRGI